MMSCKWDSQTLPFRYVKDKIASGYYSERSPVVSKDEIGKLADSFNMMASAVEEHVEELKLEDQKKQMFIDNLSHEMRTPLTAIIGYAEMLKSIKYDEKIFFKGLNYILSEGKRLKRLFTTLTNLILLRESELELETTSAISLINEVITIMEPFTNEKEIRLVKDCDDIQVEINPDLFKELLINLLENSIRASSNDSEIILGCKTDNISKYFYVKDYGHGMSQDEIKHIMEPFYRIDISRSSSQGGMGLGLAICQKIVEKHGAIIDIFSEVNKGTEVKINLS